MMAAFAPTGRFPSPRFSNQTCGGAARESARRIGHRPEAHVLLPVRARCRYRSHQAGLEVFTASDESIDDHGTATSTEGASVAVSRPQWLLSLPNMLTWLRVLAVPVLIVLFFAQRPFSTVGCSVLFAVAGITDAIDGKLARYLQVESAFGAFLDPVADKLMVCTALVLLTSASASPLVAIASAIIICRELFISALREWMASIGSRSKVAVGIQGKVKTTAQMIALTILLWCPAPSDGMLYMCGLVLLYVSVFFTISSAYGYVQAAFNDLL